MNYYYNPLDKACKSLTGAVTRGSEVTLRIYETKNEEVFFPQDCYLILMEDGAPAKNYPMQRRDYGWEITIRFHQTGLYFYRFQIGEGHFCCGRLRKGEFLQEEKYWQITVFAEDYSTPDWMKGGVMYQIFPDRFYKSGEIPVGANKILREDWKGTPNFRPNQFGKVLNNDFFGGNLNGVREKLDYIESLGVTVLYFNPIFEAYSNHRYDTGDYMKVDPLLGTKQDLLSLVHEAKQRGIQIILDGVFNHTGDDSRYFNKYAHYDSLGAYQSKESPYFDWYCFREFPDSYDSWWGIATLPAVNETSASYQNFIFGEDGVLKTWLRCGIGGYRLDVADELPDFFLEKLRTAVKEENPNAVIIGEVWEDASNKIAYGQRRSYFHGRELDSVMNYPLKDAIIDFLLTGKTLQLRETIAMLIDNYPKDSLDSLMNILGTHDTARILTVLGGKPCWNKEEMAVTFLNDDEHKSAKAKLKIAALLQFTLPGVPCVYYGDENGMEGYSDPFCRRCFDWDNLDEGLITFYRKLGTIRKELREIFQDGIYREIFADDSCIVFERRNNNSSVYVYANRSHLRYDVTFSGNYTDILTGQQYANTLTIEGYAFGMITKNK